MATTIELRSISKYFGSVIALKDISISVNSGEVLCLLGDNGAGTVSYTHLTLPTT